MIECRDYAKGADDVPFSTKPSSVSSRLAASSTRRGSSTFETQRHSLVADFASDPFSDGHHSTSRNLGCLAGAVGSFQARGFRFNAESVQCLNGKSAKAFHGRWDAVDERWPRARIKPKPNFHQPALADESSEDAANLVIAAQIVEIGTQKHIAALAVDPLR